MRGVTLSIVLITLSTIAFAQSDSLSIPSMREVYRQNAWLEGDNPVSLSFNGFRSFSIAEAGFSYIAGNLGNLSVPGSNYLYKVYSESFQTLGKVSVYGKLGYTNHQKRDINWQGMTNDYWQGVNLCDSVSGRQQSEQYVLSGAFALPLDGHWSIGARFDYEAELTTKDTDPRNKNQWMKWALKPGFGYQRGPIRLGASLLYASRKEEVDYQNVGNHITYPFLVAYPMAFYKTLPLGQAINWNYSAQELGGALQAELAHTSFSIYQEITGSATRQEVVSNRTQDKREGETQAWRIDYKGKLRRTASHHLHEWNWQLILDRSSSYEPLQRQETSNVWITYGEVLRSSLLANEYKVSYRYARLRDAWNPIYSISAGVNFQQDKTRLHFYPTEYTQPIHGLSFQASADRNFLLPHGQLDCLLGGEFRIGGGDLINVRQLASDQTAPDIALWQNKDRLEQAFDYRTLSRWNIRLSVTYTNTGDLRWFASLTGKYEYAYNSEISRDVTYFSASFGLLF